MGLASKIMIPQNFNVCSCHLAFYAECIYRGVVGIEETAGRHMSSPLACGYRLLSGAWAPNNDRYRPVGGEWRIERYVGTYITNVATA
jgi:hypothetical protein